MGSSLEYIDLLVRWSVGRLVHWSIGRTRMSNVSKVKLLSERTSGVSPVIFPFALVVILESTSKGYFLKERKIS